MGINTVDGGVVGCGGGRVGFVGWGGGRECWVVGVVGWWLDGWFHLTINARYKNIITMLAFQMRLRQ